MGTASLYRYLDRNGGIELPLEEGPAGYAMFKEKTDGCVRAVFRP